MTERIRLSGRLDVEGRLTLRPAFPTTIPPERWRHETLRYVVEVLDAQGAPLARLPLSASGTCHTESISLRGTVDLPDGAARLDVLKVDATGREAMLLASQPVPEQAPEIRLLSVPEGEVDGDFALTWEASGRPAPVRFFVEYSCGGERWEPLSLGLDQPGLAVDFAVLAGGDDCRVAVTASNGMRAARVESGPFRVPRKPCAAVISQPVDGQETPPDVVLVGNGWWREEGRPELDALTWSSDVHGELGRGRVVTARLDPGSHHITLRAGDGDRGGTSTVRIHVGE